MPLARFVVLLFAAASLCFPAPVFAQESQLDPFVGHWGRHGFSLSVTPGGYALANWRTYRWCGPGVSGACDFTIENNIIGGGSANITFDSIEGAVAYGCVLTTTDPGGVW